MLDSTDANSPQIERETNEVVTELDEEAQLKMEVIQTLLEPCVASHSRSETALPMEKD